MPRPAKQADHRRGPQIHLRAGHYDKNLFRSCLSPALICYNKLEKVSTGPFGQFQNCGDDEDSLTSLVMQLLRRNPDAAPRDEAVRTQVRIFRQNVERILKTRGKAVAVPPASEEQNVAKLFEEVKAMVRELPERVDNRTISVSRRGLGRRFRPGMIEELMFRPFFPNEKGGMAYSWLIVLSLLRDDFPWLYEPG